MQEKEFLTRQQIQHMYPQKPLIAVLVADGSSDEELISSIPKKKLNKSESREP